MNPSNFPQSNVNFVADGCMDLPTLRTTDPDGNRVMITRWTMTWRERFRVLFSATVWMGVMGTSHPPVWLDSERPFDKEKNDDDASQKA